MQVMIAAKNMTRRKFASIAAAAVLTVCMSIPGAHALTPQEQHVSALTSDVIALAHSGKRGPALQSSVARMLNQHSNISSVARFALGPYRAKLPAAQKREYYNLVQKYVAALFAEYVNDFAGTGVDIEKSRKSGKFVLVYSRIRSAGTKLIWRVYSTGNKHRITDVNFRGIWLSIRMRDQFVSVLKNHNGDFGALLSYLRTKS